MSAAPETTLEQRHEAIGKPIWVKGYNSTGKIVGWSGHAQPWPLARLVSPIPDPDYFGSLLVDDADALRAALTTR